MQYSLTVENPDTGVWSELDLGDEKPAMNYQINNLNELKDRQAAYSQAIKLPLSDNNCRILAFIDIFSARAVAAYSPRRCKLFCEGIEISPFGAQLIIDAVSDVIECQIVSRTRDLFIALDSAPMDNVDWSYVFMSYQSLYGSNAPTTIRHRFPLLVADNAPGYVPDLYLGGYELRQLQECLPAVQFIDLVKYIFNRQGFNFKSDLYDDPEVMKDYIVCGALRNRYEQMDGQGALWTGNVQIPVETQRSLFYEIPLPAQPAVDQKVAITIPPDVSTGIVTYRMRYYAVQPCVARITYSCLNFTGQPINDTARRINWWMRHFKYSLPGYDDVGSGYVTTSSSSPDYTAVREVEMNAGDYVSLELQSIASSSLAISTVQIFEVTIPHELNNNKQFLLKGMGMVEGTGFKSHNEIVKTFLQTYGLLIDVRRFTPTGEEDDYREGDVYAYTFAELYRRKDAGRYVDWSDKVVMDAKNTAGFKTGNYARRNFIEAQKYRDEDTRAPERGYFDVNNEALEKEKTLFTLPLASGNDIFYLRKFQDTIQGNMTVAQVRAMTVEKNEILTEDEEQEPRVVFTRDFSTCAASPTLVRIDDSTTAEIAINQGYLLRRDIIKQPGWVQDMPIARHRPISYQVERYYASLQKLLHDARTLKVQVYLDVLDIYNLDFFTPVYIEYFGAFFYISKINNFIAGRLTTVELVKL